MKNISFFIQSLKRKEKSDRYMKQSLSTLFIQMIPIHEEMDSNLSLR